ncbi:DUF4270 family protein [Longitalea luteola]|uniref:DUF4270 family protein n=1 Tax=Longitalea luteola TaxID=2812563 RepID=UPI001A966FB5|nr:DUF4270 family protein [Longitalea luteola]
MYIHKRVPVILTLCFLFSGLLSSCYKKDIQVGSELAESHTRIITVDTVGVLLSSFVLDSFPTNGNSFALIGNYHDTYTGKTNASTFFQLGLPTLAEDLLPKSAVYDSLVLFLKPNGYYYGDTTQPLAISIYQLAEQPVAKVLSNGQQEIYNRSSFALKGAPLASFSRLIRPRNETDTITVRLPQAMGEEFYQKIQNKASEFTSSTNFLDYFRGLCLQPTNNNAGAVYGFNMGDSSISMRLHYHLTVPDKQDKVLEFVMTNSSLQFNRILTDRQGTLLEKTFANQQEFVSNNTHPYAITQSGTGVYLKARFPSLRDVLKINEVVRLMDARLEIKPIRGSYSMFVNQLPGTLFMKSTDITNVPGGILTDTTGGGTPMIRRPEIDYLYGASTKYTFHVTSYINALLNTPGSIDNGLFILEEDPAAAKQINRAVIGNYLNGTNYQTRLILNLLTIE